MVRLSGQHRFEDFGLKDQDYIVHRKVSLISQRLLK